MLEGLGTGAIALDSAARVLVANTAAERILARSRGLRIDADGRLVAATDASNRRLADHVRAAMGGTDVDQGRHVLRLPNPGQATPLTLLVSPLPRPAFVLARDLEEARVMILVLGDQPIAAERLARDVFDLSPAEAKVATLVAAGKDRPEIARSLGISVETVKTHLQRCFFKTGTHSQREMARLLLQMPVEND
jgi:DNA-binding CsgD family transcriptional regulator